MGSEKGIFRTQQWVEMLGWYIIHITVEMMEEEKMKMKMKMEKKKLESNLVFSKTTHCSKKFGGRHKINKAVDGISRYGHSFTNTSFPHTHWHAVYMNIKLMIVTACRE
jgi:hypothetical protein